MSYPSSGNPYGGGSGYPGQQPDPYVAGYAAPYGNPQQPYGSSEYSAAPYGTEQYPNQYAPTGYPPPPSSAYPGGFQSSPGHLGPEWNYTPGGYPPIPAAGFSAGESWNWAWAQFTKRIGLLVGAPLAWSLLITIPFLLIYAVVFGLLFSAALDPSSQSGAFFAQSAGFLMMVVFGVMYLAILGAGLYMAGCQLSAHLDIADGKPVTFGTFFRARNLGGYFAAAVLVGLGVGVGFVLLIIPGLVFALFAMFAPAFAIDRGMGAIDSIKASIQLVRDNFAQVFLVFLIMAGLMFGAYVLSFITMGIGGLVSFPAAGAIVGLIQVFTYRRLTGGFIAAVPAV